MMRRACLAAVALLWVLALSFGVRPAGAAQATAAGWWWRVQTGQGILLPPPPNVPEGGLMVQGSPDGASAVAAVRYTLAPDESGPVLTLRFAEGGDTGAEDAIVLACPLAAGANWSAGPAQRWDAQPANDCATRQAVGVLSDDGAAMVFDLSSFASPPVVEVVLVAGVVEGRPSGADGSVFNLVFEEPLATDLQTVAAGAPVPATTTTTLPRPGPPPAPGRATPAPAPVAPSFRPPASLVPVALPPAAPSRPAPQASGSPPGAATQIASTTAPDGPPRWFAIALLAATAGAAVLLRGSASGAAPAWLAGAVAADASGGVGRFAKPREGAPPSLL